MSAIRRTGVIPVPGTMRESSRWYRCRPTGDRRRKSDAERRRRHSNAERWNESSFLRSGGASTKKHYDRLVIDAGNPTRSVADGIPTQSVGTSRHSFGHVVRRVNDHAQRAWLWPAPQSGALDVGKAPLGPHLSSERPAGGGVREESPAGACLGVNDQSNNLLCFSSRSSCSRMYFRTISSSRPTVLTQ